MSSPPLHSVDSPTPEEAPHSLPSIGDTPLATAAKAQRGLRAPRACAPRLDARWSATVLRGLAQDPERHFKSAWTFPRRCERCKADPRPGCPEPKPHYDVRGTRTEEAFHNRETKGCSMKPLTPNGMKLGFIGLGHMGNPIARRLLAHGYHLSVYDMDPVKTQASAEQGAGVAKNIIELARTCDVLLSSLTNDEVVRSVYSGPEGVFAAARSGTVVLEMSTISPESSRELHRLGTQKGIEVLDVAVSGSTPAAEQGSLTLLVGGNQELFDAAEPIFRWSQSNTFVWAALAQGHR
jgi:hypothetical protein